MNSPNELKEITRFLLEYANRLMGSGVHTSRVIRNTRRIGKSLDVDVKMSLFQKTMVVSVCDIDSTEVYNEVAIIPAFPISFELNAELSALSWEGYDNHLPLDTCGKNTRKSLHAPKWTHFAHCSWWDLPMHHSAPCSVATGLHVSLYSLPLS